MSQEVGEYYLLHRDIALRLSRSERWVLEKIRAGAFGARVIEQGGDYLVPQSDYNAFIRSRQIFDEQGVLKPVYARTSDEARRKLRGLRSPRSVDS